MCPIYLQIKSGLSLLLEEGGTKVNLASIVIPQEDEGYNDWSFKLLINKSFDTLKEDLINHASDMEDPVTVAGDVHEKGVAAMLYRLLSSSQRLSSDALNKELSANTEIVCLWESDREH